MKLLKTLTCSLAILTLSACVELALGVAAITAVNVGADNRSLGTIVDDEAIELRIRHIIQSNPWMYRPSNISILSVGGIVLATGQTTDPVVRTEIVKIAREDGRVRHIVNEIEIAEPVTLKQRALESVLQGKVKTHLALGEGLKSVDIKTQVEGETVYLLGEVTHEDAKTAADIASRVSGIKKVVKVFNYLD